MPASTLTAEQTASYQRDGFVIIPGMFTPEETELLARVAKADLELQQGARAHDDSTGRTTKLNIRYVLEDDLYSAVIACERMVRGMEQLLGGPVCHFHHKMMLKEPLVGGAWEWHQDYGYWYEYEGFLFPCLASCMVAVDRANRDNGCLQVLRGSHHLGRLTHGRVGEQTGSDPERTAAAAAHLERVYVEIEPGDGVFFHCNLLHRSDANESPNARWTLIGCYYAQRNPAVKAVTYNGRPATVPVPDGQVAEIGRREAAAVAES